MSNLGEFIKGEIGMNSTGLVCRSWGRRTMEGSNQLNGHGLILSPIHVYSYLNCLLPT